MRCLGEIEIRAGGYVASTVLEYAMGKAIWEAHAQCQAMLELNRHVQIQVTR